MTEPQDAAHPLAAADPTHLRERVIEFEQTIRAGLPQDMELLGRHPLLAWDLSAFVDAYLAGGQYPPGRLPQVVDRLIDLKLQLYLVMQVSPATSNAMVYNRGFNLARPMQQPALQLARLAYLQGRSARSGSCGSG